SVGCRAGTLRKAAAGLRPQATSSSRPLPIWVMLGPPGSGKGTYASALAPRFGLDHFSTGDLAREALQKPENAALRQMMNSGQLLPNSVIFQLLKQRLEQVPDTASAVLLDGFPRTVEQAEMLEAIRPVSLALQIVLKDRHILDKIAGRRSCGSCRRGFNVVDIHDDEDGVFMPPILPAAAAPGSALDRSQGQHLRCDCGGNLVKRADDLTEVAAERLRLHHAEAGPLISYYAAQGVLMQHRVRRGVGDMDELSTRLRQRLDEPAPSHSLDRNERARL
ncbi:unnamed protein product, partial [Polarella glacialis]